MTHKEISQNTKLLLSTSLKHFLEKKPLNKISVTDIIKDCDVNRNTFYYHFSNIYELFQWTIESETFTILQQFDLTSDFEESLRFVLDYVKSNKVILNNVYHTLGQDQLRQLLKKDFEAITEKMIEETSKAHAIILPDSHKYFLIQFYSSAIANTFIAYISSELDLSDEELLHSLTNTIKSTLPAALTCM